jgi:hypothetical protein
MLDLILIAAGELFVSALTAIYEYNVRFYPPVNQGNSESADEKVETASRSDGQSRG